MKILYTYNEHVYYLKDFFNSKFMVECEFIILRDIGLVF
jgi:hypothetical protein